MLLQCLPSSFSYLQLKAWEMLFEEFQDSCHLGYWNGMILAMLNLRITPMPLDYAQSNLQFGRRCSLKIFKMEAGYWNGRILASPNLYVTPMSPIKFWLNPTFSKEMLFDTFQDGYHGGRLGYRNGTILAMLNVTALPSTKFRLNSTYGLEGDVVWNISRWPQWQPSLILELKDFSYFESPWSHNASQQVSAHSDLRFWRIC